MAGDMREFFDDVHGEVGRRVRFRGRWKTRAAMSLASAVLTGILQGLVDLDADG